MKPQFGLSKTIDGSRSLQEFSLKKYKHLSKLKVVKLLNTILNQNLATPTPILQKLSTSVKNLDLSQYDSLKTYSSSQIKLIAKRFHKITRLSLLGERYKTSINSLLLAKRMLKEAKNLRHLSLKDILDNSSTEQISQLISRSKLKTITLIPFFSAKSESTSLLLSFPNYCPSTVEELSLSWKHQTRSESKLNLSLNHLDNLQKLELGMPFALETFQGIVGSIQDPFKLKTLRFHLEKLSKKKSLTSDVQAFLENLSHLEELTIQTSLDVYLNNSSIKLKKLSIDSTEDLLRYLDFIQQQKESLESLCLTSRLKVYSPINKLLEGLEPLKRLMKLQLNVRLEVSSVNALDLAQLIEALECLEDLDVMNMVVIFSENGFEKFCKALVRRCGGLKSLKVSFNNWSLNQKDSNLLVQTLKLLSGLEHITLKDFGMEDERFFSELREIVCCKNKNLNEVILESVIREKAAAYCENFKTMLKDIIHKPTMKKFSYLEASEIGLPPVYEGPEILSWFDDVRKEVYHFDYLHFPSYICKPSLYSWNLSWHKWAQGLN